MGRYEGQPPLTLTAALCGVAAATVTVSLAIGGTSGRVLQVAALLVTVGLLFQLGRYRSALSNEDGREVG